MIFELKGTHDIYPQYYPACIMSFFKLNIKTYCRLFCLENLQATSIENRFRKLPTLRQNNKDNSITFYQKRFDTYQTYVSDKILHVSDVCIRQDLTHIRHMYQTRFDTYQTYVSDKILHLSDVCIRQDFTRFRRKNL